MTTVIIFASSLFMTLFLILIKALELKREKKNFFLKFISQLDAKSHELVAIFKFKSLQFIQIVRYLATIRAKEFFKNLLQKIIEKAINEYRARQKTIIMGRKEIGNNGSVSFYLKKISEDKNKNEKGRIDQD